MNTETATGDIVWPNRAGCAASFSFDVDGESAVLAADPGNARSLSVMTHQSYGPRVGVRRLLDILERTRTRSTFFVPGYTADLHPGTVRDIAAAGHEISHHGYHHQKPAGLELSEQIEQLDRGSDALERLTACRPSGYRAPMWDLSWEMPALLAERGFNYDSSLMDGDAPYLLKTTAGTLTEIPIHWTLDDWEQYCYLPDITELGPIQTPEHAIALWRSELEGMRRFGGCWVLTNHPFLSGRPGRAAALEALIGEVQAMPDVWVAALDEIAAHAANSGLVARPLPKIEASATPTNG